MILHEGEVLPEKPGDEREGQEDGGDDRQLSRHLAQPVGHRGQVHVECAAQEVAIAVEEIREPDELVVGDPEKERRALVLVWEPYHLRCQPTEHVPLGHHHPAHLHDVALHAEETLQMLVGGARHDLGLEVVDLVVDVLED